MKQSMQLKLVAPTLSLIFLGALAGSASAIELGQVDDFNDGTAQSWTIGSANADIAPSNVNNQLQLETNGLDFGVGHRLVAFNRDQWSGNYLEERVTAITLDVTNLNDDQLLNLRLGIIGGGGIFVTDAIDVASGSVNQAIRFDLDEASLIALSGFSDFDATLENVSELRLLHNPNVQQGSNGSPIGAPLGSPPIAAAVQFDNIRAVPEPSVAVLLGLVGGATLLVVRPLRQRCPV